MFIQDSFSVNVSGIRTNWELRVYPNGYDDENSGYLGIFVKHKEGNSHRYDDENSGYLGIFVK